jgi:hypothetical protein
LDKILCSAELRFSNTDVENKLPCFWLHPIFSFEIRIEIRRTLERPKNDWSQTSVRVWLLYVFAMLPNLFCFLPSTKKNWPYFKRKCGLAIEEELVLTNVCSSSDFPIWTFFSSEKDKFLREISSTVGGPENEFVENVWKLQNLTKLETCIWYYGFKNQTS